MITINRSDIIKELALRIYGEARSDTISICSQFCDKLVDIISEELEFGEDIKWKGFLSVKLIDRKERRGKNPNTHKVVTYPPGTSIRCRLSKSIKDRVNSR